MPTVDKIIASVHVVLNEIILNLTDKYAITVIYRFCLERLESAATVMSL